MVKRIRRKAKQLAGLKDKAAELALHEEPVERLTQRMVAKHSNRLALVERLIALANDKNVKYHNPKSELGRLQRLFFQRVLNSLYAILTLVIHGAVHDATVVLRTMFEFAVSAAYLQKFPDHIERFKRFEPIERYKWAKNLHGAGLLDETKTDEWAKLEEAASQWQKEGLGQGFWTGQNFAKTVKACGLQQLQEFCEWFYPQASKFVHPSPTGLLRQIDSESNDLEPYPLEDDSEKILGHAIAFLIYVFRIRTANPILDERA